ncbi:DsrE family protein [Aestuariibacter halophilus]|uniref:DsrE family protein n=1 Tax=Fluctibacter halophilus TaxID=226011 RepID=A0ABS8G6L8_9ALTE|nr:DsrE family protein [Aestuariibacter halophilus]MCC2616237.1 DsrE family protein [Aestuariibacter halophilus]
MKTGLFFGLLMMSAGGLADDFATGPLLKDFGPHAPVKGAEALPAQAVFKVAFDVAEAAKPGEVNRKFVSLARFLNMHVANGIPAENIHLALVVHGKASQDLLSNAAYRARFDADNGNVALLDALAAQGVSIRVCGQSATYYQVDRDNLLPQVTLSLSAMTAHALLQQQGYTLNPF